VGKTFPLDNHLHAAQPRTHENDRPLDHAMKSFHLHTGSKGELIQFVIALLIGVGLFLALHHFHITETAYQVMAVLAGAVFVGYLCRGQLCRRLRGRYPNARWVGLLAVGFAIATFGVIARFVVPGADEGAFTLAFILPVGACIATFVIINRKDPDVRR
jgi:peptidoglycan/LPS O-acetylase OafA/YrhL